MKQLWGAVFLLAVLVGAGWAASLGQTTTLELTLGHKFAAVQREQFSLAAQLGGTIGALRIAEARIDDLERRVSVLERPKPKPARRATPVFARGRAMGR